MMSLKSYLRILIVNVYPVPDGDTGTNMYSLPKSVIEELDGRMTTQKRSGKLFVMEA